MDWFKRKSFRHGIHPPDYKEETNQVPIQRFPFAPLMIIPFLQHIGKAAKPVVREGQEVIRGQIIAQADGFLSVPIHAPASGIVKRIALVPDIKGDMVPGLYLESLPSSTQEVVQGSPCPLHAAPEDIVKAIQDAGIVGLGGAMFPTHAKMKLPEGKSADTLLINAVECEPYLTTDHRVILEQTEDIFTGARYLLKACGAKRAIIGVEANKLDAAEALKKAVPDDLAISVEVLEIKYPQGAEKILIKALLNREIPSGGRSVDVHVIGINVATTAEVGRLLPKGRGIQERVITIGGPAIEKKGNYRIPIGTPLRFLLESVGVSDDLSQVFMGGPMMGPAAPNLDIPVIKGTSGVIAFTQKEMRSEHKTYPCIHCGHCVEACPLFLNPAQLGMFAKKEQYEIMVEQFHLLDCFECGCCAFVCPSHIPLVQLFRVSKNMIKKLQAA